MIAQLTGQVVDIAANTVVLDVAGVGYEVEVTSAALALLPAPTSNPAAEVTLHTHMVVREDAQLLYGFASRNERELFRALIRVNGVGPKLALSLLSALSLGELARAVAGKDIAALTKIPGVGRKTAERLLMELKDKMENLAALFPASASPDNGLGADVVVSVTMSEVHSEALAALVGLGYRANEVAHVLDQIVAQRRESGEAEATTEELVRLALRYFYKQADAG